MNNELKVLEKISHPNVVRIYELLHDDQHYYIVSELIRHGELYQFINDKSNNVVTGGLTEFNVINIVK